MISPPPGLSPTSTVFPVASGLSRRQPPLLLPGCDGQAPRALTGRDDSRSPEDQAARAKSPLALLLVPRLRSLSNSGRTLDFRSHRRNRSAPWLSWTTECTGYSALASGPGLCGCPGGCRSRVVDPTFEP